MRHRLEEYLNRVWYEGAAVPSVLRWLSRIYATVVQLRRKRQELLQQSNPVPVIIVGNITVGGSGKTPTVIGLANYLKSQGWHPGIISRGYKAAPPHWPFEVHNDTDVTFAGDEPLLIAKRTACPLVIDGNRRRGLAHLLKTFPDTNVIIADDGLQHYSLARDIEIALIDAQRGLGNCQLLPAGPLREPASRLGDVDFVLINGNGESSYAGHVLSLRSQALQPLLRTAPRHGVPTGGRVHAVAGISNPQRFFSTLEALGFEVVPHGFPDHHRFSLADLKFNDGLPIIMTEKDAVKCQSLWIKNAWYLPVQAEFSATFLRQLSSLLIRFKRSTHD